MISAIKENIVKRGRKKSFRVSFAPGINTNEEQINDFVNAVECKGPGIDDLTRMIKSLPSKKASLTEKRHDQEADSISNIIFHLRQTLDNMLENECNNSFISQNDKHSRNPSVSSVDSAISDCNISFEHYRNLNNSKKNNSTDSFTSSKTHQKVTDLLKELDNCIEELREDDIYSIEEETSQAEGNALCVKDIFAAGILIASFVQTKFETSAMEQQYAVLTDNKIYIFESNRSKAPLKFTFSFNNSSSIKRVSYNNNALEIAGECINNRNEKISKNLIIAYSSTEECNIWLKLLLDIIKSYYSSSNQVLKRTARSDSLKHNSRKSYEQFEDYYNPRQTILSALCVLESIENSKTY